MSGTTRRGLVLGGGGVLGAAWMVGALQALQDETGVDVRDFDAFVGTSAGSVLVALLGAGVSVEDLVNHQRDGQLESGPLAGFHFDYEKASGGDRPMRPRPGLGSRELLIRNARQLRQLPPTAVLSAFLPEGRGNLDAVGALISHVVPDGWVARDGVTVVALDYDTGERMPFGRPGARPAALPEAVMASCAIPGWYQPVRIGDHRFIDGGAWSSTNLDLLAGSGSGRGVRPRPAGQLRRRRTHPVGDPAGAAVAQPGDPQGPPGGGHRSSSWHGGHRPRPRAGRPRGHGWQPDGRLPSALGHRDLAAHLRPCPA